MADIFGRNPVIEALRSDSEINKIYLAKGELQGSAKEIVALAKEKGVQIQTIERAKLDQMFPKENHQGVAASIAEANYVDWQDMLESARKKGEDPLLIILDELEDPHNLGAILRSADAVGAHGVIIPKRRAVALTAGVAKAAAGASQTAAKKAAAFAGRHPAGVIIAIAALLLFIMVSVGLSSCGAMFSGSMNSVLGTSYTSEDSDLVATEQSYAAMENELQQEIDNIESTHSGYDEYRYDLDTIGHNPHELASYLTALLHGNRLAEEDDMRTQQRTVGSAVVETLLDAVERQDKRRIVRRTKFGKLPVQVENMRRTRPFVQIVDILGDDPDVEIAFQTGNRPVGGVRLGLEHFGTPLVVETDDAPTIEIKRFGNADLLDPVIPPCSVGVAERRQTAVGADAGAGEDNKFFHCMM